MPDVEDITHLFMPAIVTLFALVRLGWDIAIIHNA